MINCSLKFTLVLECVKGIQFQKAVGQYYQCEKNKNGCAVILPFCELTAWEPLHNDWM